MTKAYQSPDYRDDFLFLQGSLSLLYKPPRNQRSCSPHTNSFCLVGCSREGSKTLLSYLTCCLNIRRKSVEYNKDKYNTAIFEIIYLDWKLLALIIPENNTLSHNGSRVIPLCILVLQDTSCHLPSADALAYTHF